MLEKIKYNDYKLKYSDYKLKSDMKTTTMTFLLIFAFGGIFGFVYEELFYRIDLGYFVKRGTTMGPWIPIYGYGSILITAATCRLRKKPLMVFLTGGLVSGMLEYATGYYCYYVAGIRLWDYNKEILNWGNIDGFICLRSVLFFALSSLILIYMLIPFIQYLKDRLSKRTFGLMSLGTGLLFFADAVAADILHLY